MLPSHKDNSVVADALTQFDTWTSAPIDKKQVGYFFRWEKFETTCSKTFKELISKIAVKYLK